MSEPKDAAAFDRLGRKFANQIQVSQQRVKVIAAGASYDATALAARRKTLIESQAAQALAQYLREVPSDAETDPPTLLPAMRTLILTVCKAATTAELAADNAITWS
jgi:hypothetical protein